MTDPPTLQKICGWCRREISAGAQPATYGICPKCYLLAKAETDRAKKGGA